MTFSKQVKEELCKINSSRQDQLLELAGLIHISAQLNLFPHNITFKSNNLTVVRRYLMLMKSLYAIKDSGLAAQNLNFTKSKQFQITISEDLERITSEHDFFDNEKSLSEIIKTHENKQAYLRGVFLASGSINDPKTANYHLEIFSLEADAMIFVQTIINDFGLNAKITKRRNGFICYLKNVESIIDFLRIIGASKTVFHFEDLKIKRELNNSITRVMNVELANEKKALMVANKQLADIKLIKSTYPQLDDKLERVIQLRLDNEEATLKELVEIYNQKYLEKITKSGLNHRFIRLKELAAQIKTT